MSRSARGDDRVQQPRPTREFTNYVSLAKQSGSLDDYKRELAKRNVTSEMGKEWQKAMTAWQAVETSRYRGGEPGTKEHRPASKEMDYAALAGQFRHRSEYEKYLVREHGLKSGTNEWKKAAKAFDFKEHLEDQQRRPDRAPRHDHDDRRAIERAEDRLIQVARECRTREEFDRYLREELKHEPGSVKYETAMLAWAVFKRETEGF